MQQGYFSSPKAFSTLNPRLVAALPVLILRYDRCVIGCFETLIPRLVALLPVILRNDSTAGRSAGFEYFQRRVLGVPLRCKSSIPGFMLAVASRTRFAAD
jgi:hypothetical protein